MLIRLTLACTVAVAAAVASADRLELVDGRTLEGTVTIEGQTVLLKMTYGTLRFSKSRVRSVILQDTPEEILARKLAAAPKNNAEALFAVAQWAAEAALKPQAKQLLEQVIELEPDHAAARRKLGLVRMDRKWHSFDKAIELARSKLEAGKHDDLLEKILPDLAEVSTDPGKQLAVRDLLAQTHLRAGQFTDAAKTFSSLARKSVGPAAVRYAAIAAIITDNPDGMYVLTEAYPPGSPLLGKDAGVLKSGPASLSDPQVLAAALWHSAKKCIDDGSKLMAVARKLEAASADAAKSKYLLASRTFDRADALAPGIAKSWHVEIARRRIAGIRQAVDAAAEGYEAVKAQLGKEDLTDTPEAYLTMVSRLSRHLDRIHEDLKNILVVAEPHPRALIMEIKWAETDMKKVEQMRKVLAIELDTVD